ncbi:MAG: hypothetical protein AAFX06_12400 [Planctomycetota bacterium]
MSAEIQQYLDQSEATRRTLQEALWVAKTAADHASEGDLQRMLAVAEENAQLSSDLSQLILDRLTDRRLQSDAKSGLREALENPPASPSSKRMTG